MSMNAWQEPVRAADLPPQELASVLDLLLERLGLQIVREQTPDYTSYELQEKPAIRNNVWKLDLE